MVTRASCCPNSSCRSINYSYRCEGESEKQRERERERERGEAASRLLLDGNIVGERSIVKSAKRLSFRHRHGRAADERGAARVKARKGGNKRRKRMKQINVFTCVPGRVSRRSNYEPRS